MVIGCGVSTNNFLRIFLLGRLPYVGHCDLSGFVVSNNKCVSSPIGVIHACMGWLRTWYILQRQEGKYLFMMAREVFSLHGWRCNFQIGSTPILGWTFYYCCKTIFYCWLCWMFIMLCRGRTFFNMTVSSRYINWIKCPLSKKKSYEK